MELQEIIAMTRRLCEAPGTSGREDGAAKAAEELLAPWLGDTGFMFQGAEG